MRTTRMEGRSSGVGAVVGVALAISAGCGGPSVPTELPASSPLARDAPSAPLPELGSSFEEPPEVSAEEGGAPHQHHGGHGHAH